MQTIFDLLAATPLLLLFVVIGLGYLLGTVKVAGFSLGPAAVLFTGIFLGSVDSRLRLPDFIYVFGLILFVYTIGLQSGSTFFGSFNRRGLLTNAFAFGMVLFGAVLTFFAWKLFDLDGETLVGVYCGALTNTPALAASVETIKGLLTGTSSVEIANAPVIGYSVAYPFGVIGVLLGFYTFSLMKRGSNQEHEESKGPLAARTFCVTKESILKKSVRDIRNEYPGMVLSRLRRGNYTSLVYPETTFEKNDLVVVVGTEADLQRAKSLFGSISFEEIQQEKEELDYRRIIASEKNVVGKKLRDLQLQELLDVTITRIRRGDVDFVPNGDTVIEYGDRVRILTWVGNIERVTKYFGDSMKHSSEADFFSVSLGIVVGVLIGMVPIPLPGGGTFSLGFAGGPLLVGLVLGRLQRTGHIVWGMPFSANLTLRQIGLVLFLAGVGTKAGDSFIRTLAAGGWAYAAVGVGITLMVTFATLILATRFFKLSLPAVMGMMSGIQTQPACLAYANEHAPGNAANVWYASVYPMSMIGKIVLAQVLTKIFFN